MPDLRGPFRFDTVAHQYSVGAVIVPGIHAVLRAGGLEHAVPGYTAMHRERGKAVHYATLMHDLGDTDVRAGLREEWRPFFDAYLTFRADVPCRWRKLEHPKVHRRLRYATILDRVGSVSGYPSVFEIKTGYPAPSHGPQLAGSDLLLGRGRRRRLAVYLHADGTYRLQDYEAAADYIRFLRAVEDYWTVTPAEDAFDAAAENDGRDVYEAEGFD